MISVFLLVEDYYLNYESKVENSFVNAIAPQKKFVPPPTKSPDCSCSHPRRSPSKASAYLPASPPSYPEESSQSLHAKKRISPPTSLPSAPKGNSPIRSSIRARQYPTEAKSTASSPSPRSLSRLSNDPLQTLTGSPRSDTLRKELKQRRNHPPLYPPTNAPFP